MASASEARASAASASVTSASVASVCVASARWAPYVWQLYVCSDYNTNVKWPTKASGQQFSSFLTPSPLNFKEAAKLE